MNEPYYLFSCSTELLPLSGLFKEIVFFNNQ